MPFEQKYTPETRDASLERVLTRREAEPGNRAIIRETAEEFQVGEQSLRGWIRAHEKANAPAKKVAAEPAAPAAKAAAPVATTAAAAPAASESAPAAPRRSPGRPSAASTSDARVAELEAEVAKLRRDREALKSALGVLLGD